MFRTAKHVWLLLLFAGVHAFTGAGTLRAQTPVFSPDAVKAAYLLNFIKFSEWPDENEQSNFTIGVVGNRDIEQELWRLTTGQRVRGKPIQVKRLITLREASDCDVMYLDPQSMSGSGEFDAAHWLQAVKDRPVLTVSDYAAFLSEGGVIDFHSDGPNLTFEIDLAHAQASKVKMSSRLLALSRPTKIKEGVKP